MSRASKRKLAIVAGISECLVYAEAKYCAFEIHGEAKYYVCPRTEYCCNFGCCVSPGFQIYHLWYYWLLVIIMFLVCSGGGWWYRYWLQGRYRAAASVIPSRGTTNSRSQNALRGPSCPAQQASITYNSARNTVLLHRMWKAGGPHRGPGSSPAYTGPSVAAAASSTHFQNTSVVLNDVNCPYYQLYGPPPSYETVIAQTRGKLSSPLSPERSRNADVSSATGTSSLANQELATHCYNHSPYNNVNHPSQPGNVASMESAVSRYEASVGVVDAIRRLDSSLDGSSGYSRYASSYVDNGAEDTTPVHTAGRQDTRLPLHYHGGPIPPLDHRDDRASIVASESYRIYNPGNNLERLPSYHGERNSLDPKARRSGPVSSNSRRSSLALACESRASVPDLKIASGIDLDSPRVKSPNEEQRYSRTHGGSLKFSRFRDDANTRESSRLHNCPEIGITASWRNEASAGGSNESRICKDTAATNVARFTDFGQSDVTDFSRSTRNGLLGDYKGCARSMTTHYGNDEPTNPSENVILEPLTAVNINEPGEGAASTASTTAVVVVVAAAAAGSTHDGRSSSSSSSSCWRTRMRRRENDDKRRRRVPSADDDDDDDDDDVDDDGDKVFDEFSINNHESKQHKLARSQSLD